MGQHDPCPEHAQPALDGSAQGPETGGRGKIEGGGEPGGSVPGGSGKRGKLAPGGCRVPGLQRQAHPEGRQGADKHSGRKGPQRFHLFATISPMVTPEE